MTNTTSHCPGCGEYSFLMPLHGDKGGPLRCPLCIGAWHAEHGRRRRLGRIVIRALAAYMDGGGKWGDLEKLKLSAMGTASMIGFDLDPLGYLFETASTSGETIELTSDLLANAIKIAHPDLHPPERRELAQLVTQGLLALQPFTFPAEKPKPLPAPICDAPKRFIPNAKLSRPSYPCEGCADTVPYFYCTACSAEWNKRCAKEREQENAKQRKWYARRRAEELHWRKPTLCAACGKEFKAKRKGTRFCSNTCRQKAHRESVTDKSSGGRGTLNSRDTPAAREATSNVRGVRYSSPPFIGGRNVT
jgi:hypothetical protein